MVRFGRGAMVFPIGAWVSPQGPTTQALAMIFTAENDAPGTVSAPEGKRQPADASGMGTSFSPRRFSALPPAGRGKHPDRLSQVLRSIAAQPEQHGGAQPTPSMPDAPDRVVDGPFEVAAMPRLQTPSGNFSQSVFKHPVSRINNDEMSLMSAAGVVNVSRDDETPGVSTEKFTSSQIRSGG